MNLTLKISPLLCWGLLVLSMHSCALAGKLNKTLGNIDTTQIGNIGKAAGQGLVKGADLSNLKTDLVLKNLLKDLDVLLNEELDGVDIESLQKRVTKSLDSILRNTVQDTVKFHLLQGRLNSMLNNVISNLQRNVNGLELDLVNQKLLQELDELRNELLGDKTSEKLGLVLSTALDKVASSGALVKIITKIEGVIDNLDQKTDQKIGSLQKTIKQLITGLIGLGILIFLIIAYAFWKRRQLKQYKDLSAVLTKGIDQIADRGDYDRILNLINSQVDAQQVRKQLIGILQEHQGEYPGKTQHLNYADRTLKLFREALNGNQEIRDKILDQAKAEPQLMQFVQHKLN